WGAAGGTDAPHPVPIDRIGGANIESSDRGGCCHWRKPSARDQGATPSSIERPDRCKPKNRLFMLRYANNSVHALPDPACRSGCMSPGRGRRSTPIPPPCLLEGTTPPSPPSRCVW